MPDIEKFTKAADQEIGRKSRFIPFPIHNWETILDYLPSTDPIGEGWCNFLGYIIELPTFVSNWYASVLNRPVDSKLNQSTEQHPSFSDISCRFYSTIQDDLQSDTNTSTRLSFYRIRSDKVPLDSSSFEPAIT